MISCSQLAYPTEKRTVVGNHFTNQPGYPSGIVFHPGEKIAFGVSAESGGDADKGVVAVGLIITPAGIPLVLETRPYRMRVGPYWKFPGGIAWRGESPGQALVREVETKSGIMILSGHRPVLIHRETRRNQRGAGTHDFLVFRLKFSVTPNFNKSAEVRMFMPQEILRMSDFAHRSVRVESELEAIICNWR